MTLTTAQLNKWAKQINTEITEGESKVYDSWFEGFGAEVKYECEVGEDAGDYWTAPAWWIESAKLEVVALWNEDGEDCPEELAQINTLLN
jgi:hypothetical protein